MLRPPTCDGALIKIGFSNSGLRKCSYSRVLVGKLVHHVVDGVIVDIAVLGRCMTTDTGVQFWSGVCAHSADDVGSVDTGRSVIVCDRVGSGEVVVARVVPGVVVGLLVGVVVLNFLCFNVRGGRSDWRGVERCRVACRWWGSHAGGDGAWAGGVGAA